MLITNEKLIGAGTSRIGYSRKQVEVLGVTWPLRSGWKNSLIGKAVPEHVWNEFVSAGKSKSNDCLCCAAKQKKFYRNKATAKRAESRRAKDCAPKTIVGEHYEAMRAQWELSGGDSSQCPFGDDYSGPFLDWDGNEAVIRVNLSVENVRLSSSFQRRWI